MREILNPADTNIFSNWSCVKYQRCSIFQWCFPDMWWKLGKSTIQEPPWSTPRNISERNLIGSGTCSRTSWQVTVSKWSVGRINSLIGSFSGLSSTSSKALFLSELTHTIPPDYIDKLKFYDESVSNLYSRLNSELNMKQAHEVFEKWKNYQLYLLF